jgi:hypothetical protein
LDFFCFGSNSCFFRSENFFVQRKVTRGEKIPLLLTPTSVKNFTGMVSEIKKNKSTIHDENFGMRAYTLLRNIALPQAAYPSKIVIFWGPVEEPPKVLVLS